MPRNKHINTLNRDRIRRYRAKQSDKGLFRIEGYVTQEIADAVGRASIGSRKNAVMEDLLRVGLRMEEILPAPQGFWVYVRGMADRYL